MIEALWPFLKPVLHRLDPERAHDLTLEALRYAPLPAPAVDDPSLKTQAFGLTFSNPLGLAAGFDKNGLIAHKAHRLGFGFAEIGTVTPWPQAGNLKPRLFRLADEQAVINRFGFNNLGHQHAVKTFKKTAGLQGVNIGANKDASDRVADYAGGIHAFSGRADYFTINVSSPNTPNLRDLQKPEALDDLLARVIEARDSLVAESGRTPLLLKIAPDLSLNDLDAIVRVARDRRIDGMIVSNTTVTRPGSLATSRAGLETGGLSGRPLFALSTRMLAETFLRTDRQFPLVGAGGIESAGTALAKIEAGATLLQIYSALVFQGPGLVTRIKRGLVGLDLASAVGSKAMDWAKAGAQP